MLPECDDGKCALAIHDMRKEVQEKFRKVVNSRAVATMLWEFVTKCVAKFRSPMVLDAAPGKSE